MESNHTKSAEGVSGFTAQNLFLSSTGTSTPGRGSSPITQPEHTAAAGQCASLPQPSMLGTNTWVHRAPQRLSSTQRGLLIRVVVLHRTDCSGLIFTQNYPKWTGLLLSTADGNRCCILWAGSRILSSSQPYKPKPAPAGSLHAADAKAVLHPWVLQGTHRVWGNVVLSANCIKFSRGKSLRNHKAF